MNIVACGSSYYAGLLGKLLIEKWARLPVEVAVASEFRYRDPVMAAGTLVLLITNPGRRRIRWRAFAWLGQGRAHHRLTNVVGSSITRGVDAAFIFKQARR